MAIHIFNPAEPRGNPVRSPASTRNPFISWTCGGCKCVPEGWKLTVPPAGNLNDKHVGDFILRRDDPKLSKGCEWTSMEENTLFSGGPLWRMKWGQPFNVTLAAGLMWVIETGETGPLGPTSQFIRIGSTGNKDPTFRCLGKNTFEFILQDGDTESSGDPVSVSIESYWR